MSWLRRLWTNEGGAVAVTLTLSLLPLTVAAIGAADLFQGLNARNHLQDSLDAAALAAASRGDGEPVAVSSIGANVLHGNMAAAKSDATFAAKFEVSDEGRGVVADASGTVPTLLFQTLTGSPLKISAHSKAIRKDLSACVIAFNPTQSQSLYFNGSAEVDLAECSAYANSTSSTAATLGGSSTLKAKTVEVVGGANLPGGAFTGVLNRGVRPIDDPFASVPLPTVSGCDRNSSDVRDETVSSHGAAPYVFCAGLNPSGAVTFGPGVYVVKGGDMTINSNTVVRGSGVTFVLMGGAQVHFNGGADIQLSAPLEGATRHLLFFQERVAKGGDNVFNGGAQQRLTGALYFPRQSVKFNGNTDLGSSACLALYADTIEWTGAAAFSLQNCKPVGLNVWLME